MGTLSSFQRENQIPVAGNLALQVIKTPPAHLTFKELKEFAKPNPLTTKFLNRVKKESSPQLGLVPEVNHWREENWPRIRKSVYMVLAARDLSRKFPVVLAASHLWLTKLRADGTVLPFGLAGVKSVTDVGVAFIVDAWQDIVELETMKYHGIGTDATGEAQTQIDLNAELTTEYTTNNTRATGTLAEGAANIFRSVGINAVDATVNLREHGLFDNATVASGVMFDRTVYASINLVSGDSLQSTYDLTLTAGS